MSAVTLADVQSAAERLKDVAHRTPVITSRILNERTGAEVFLKCENLQRMGAFKFRGAYNAMSRLSDAEKRRGVISYSSGNHAQAIALSGKLLGVQTTIVMPDNAPATKLAATRGYGATVVLYKPSESDRKQVAESLAAEHGYTIIPPFDHPHVIAGQGTAALELIEETGTLDLLLACVGGGGLLSGCAVATKGLLPNCRVIGSEPALGDDATQSFRTRQLVTIPYPMTIADGARTTALGELTFPLILEHVDDMVTVTEEDIKAAVRFAFFTLKLVMEPSGVLALAAILSGEAQAKGRVGVVISGGNIDAATMSQILNEA
jgi:threo-3-hydroxy-L-aspartate ammonia-lyase